MADEILTPEQVSDRNPYRPFRELDGTETSLRELADSHEALRADRDRLAAELAEIDAVMARRPALDKPTRRQNIEHAITTAGKATDEVVRLTQERDRLAAEVERLTCRKRMIDFPTAWELARATSMDQHHERCSYRVAEGGLLCDCAAMRVMEHVSGLLSAANERAEEAEAERGRLAAENARLREALAFYADPWKHKEPEDSVPDFYGEMDYGEKARAALAEAPTPAREEGP